MDDEIGRLLDRLRPLEESLEYDSDDARLIRVTRRDWEKQRRVPTELRVELIRAAALGNQVWIEARATNDFAKFLPALERNLELKRRYVECFEWTDSPYTPLLDDFEPYMLTSGGRRRVRDDPPGADASSCARRRDVDASFLHQSYPDAAQEGFYERILATLGFEDGLVPARSDRAPVLHVVLQARRAHDDALRERASTVSGRRCTRRATASTPTGSRRPSSGRRSPVLRRSASTSRRAAPGRTSWGAAGRSGCTGTSRCRRRSRRSSETSTSTSFLAAVNRAEPGLIRVEADETTYSLHIILRFELEQQLIEGSLDPKDLPEAWNAGMADLLGVEVPDDAHGVLQDIHWSQGGIGYFPTYALGNVISLQIWAVGARGDPRPRRADGGRRAGRARCRGSATTSTPSAASSRPRRRSSG